MNARDAALTIATEAVRWVAGADGGELGDLEQRLGLAAIHRAQAGLLADIQAVADALYARKRPDPGLQRKPDRTVTSPADHAVAIIGVGAILPDAPDADAFWTNVRDGHYAISDVDPARWDPALYYDADPQAPEKTYSKIGGWVRDWDWDPLRWKLPMPPQGRRRDGRRPEVGRRLHAHGARRRGLARAPARPRSHRGDPRQRDGGREALPDRLRITFPELARELERAGSFAALPAGRAGRDRGRAARQRRGLAAGDHRGLDARRAGNCIAGRIANLFNLRGPNFTVDAACASAMAAMDAAIAGPARRTSSTSSITGGVDRNMGVVDAS